MTVLRNRAHFYVYCSKVGTLWSFTDYWPFVDYEVQPFWLMGWWQACERAVQRLLAQMQENPSGSCSRIMRQSCRPRRPGVWNSTVRRLLGSWQRLDCPSDRMMIRSLVSASTFALGASSVFFNRKNAQKQTIAGSSPSCPRMDQFRWAKDRYSIYALQGQSQATKTSFVKSLFSRPLVQGQDSLNLQKFQYGHHGALILDNLVESFSSTEPCCNRTQTSTS